MEQIIPINNFDDKFVYADAVPNYFNRLVEILAQNGITTSEELLKENYRIISREVLIRTIVNAAKAIHGLSEKNGFTPSIILLPSFYRSQNLMSHTLIKYLKIKYRLSLPLVNPNEPINLAVYIDDGSYTATQLIETLSYDISCKTHLFLGGISMQALKMIKNRYLSVSSTCRIPDACDILAGNIFDYLKSRGVDHTYAPTITDFKLPDNTSLANFYRRLPWKILQGEQRYIELYPLGAQSAYPPMAEFLGDCLNLE